MSYASDVAVHLKVLSDQYVRALMYNSSHISVKQGVISSRVIIESMQ